MSSKRLLFALNVHFCSLTSEMLVKKKKLGNTLKKTCSQEHIFNQQDILFQSYLLIFVPLQ